MAGIPKCGLVILALIGSASMGLSLRPLAADDDQLVKQQILCDWRDMRSQLQNVQFSAQGTTLLLERHFQDWRHDYGDEMVGSPRRLPKEVNVQIDFGNNCVRRQVVSHVHQRGTQGWGQDDRAELFDGKEYAWVLQHPGGQGRSVVRESPSGFRFPSQSRPWLLAVGVFEWAGRGNQGQRTVDLSFNNSRQWIERLEFVKYLQLDGRQCALMQIRSESSERRREFVVDLERRSVIVRWCEYVGNRLDVSAKIDFYMVDDYWLPKGWTWVSTKDDTATICDRMRVTEIQANLPFERKQYQVAPSPGDTEFDRTGE